MSVPVTVQVPIWWFILLLPIAGAVGTHFLPFKRLLHAYLLFFSCIGVAFVTFLAGGWLSFHIALAAVMAAALMGWMAPGLCLLVFIGGGGYYVYQFFL